MTIYPRITIDLVKFRHNAENIKALCEKHNISIYPVMKGVGADRKMLEILVECGYKAVADSRIQNLKNSFDLPMEKVLLRLPMISAVDEVVQYSDISLNSEITTIQALDQAAKKQNKIHKIILMIELGDLREGVVPKDVDAIVEKILLLENIILYGVGVNLTCYGAVIPDVKNIGLLCSIADQIEQKFGITLEIISGGNSSSIPMLLNNTLPKKVNVLRLGEALLLGTESVLGTVVPGQNTDVFILESELIECKDKNSVPTGESGYDAFGKPFIKPEDKGIRCRGIVAIGRQELELDTLYPIDPKITVIGGSSDHCIIDLEDVKNQYKVGDIIQFKMHYSTMMRLMTSVYIPKHYITK